MMLLRWLRTTFSGLTSWLADALSRLKGHPPMGTEYDSIGSLQPVPAALDGTEQFEIITDKLALIGGRPNARATVDQVAAYVRGAGGVQAIAGAAYSAQKGDTKFYTRFTNAGAVTFTIPPVGDGTGGTVPWVLGDTLEFEQSGAGAVTPAAGAGVVINSRGAATATAGQFAPASLRYVGVNTWTLTGDVA
jgi:hypothetical protein